MLYPLGASVLAVTNKGCEQICFIDSILLHEDDEGQTGIGVYVRLYDALAAFVVSDPGNAAFVAQAQLSAAGQAELALNSDRVLLKGPALNFVKRTVSVLTTPSEIKNSSGEAFLLPLCKRTWRNVLLSRFCDVYIAS